MKLVGTGIKSLLGFRLLMFTVQLDSGSNLRVSMTA